MMDTEYTDYTDHADKKMISEFLELNDYLR
jgi:hypothetical protein